VPFISWLTVAAPTRVGGADEAVVAILHSKIFELGYNSLQITTLRRHASVAVCIHIMISNGITNSVISIEDVEKLTWVAVYLTV